MLKNDTRKELHYFTRCHSHPTNKFNRWTLRNTGDIQYCATCDVVTSPSSLAIGSHYDRFQVWAPVKRPDVALSLLSANPDSYRVDYFSFIVYKPTQDAEKKNIFNSQDRFLFFVPNHFLMFNTNNLLLEVGTFAQFGEHLKDLEETTEWVVEGLLFDPIPVRDYIKKNNLQSAFYLLGEKLWIEL
jgi:hypothetical protein